MNYPFEIQYDPDDIPAVAGKYLATPYKDRTAADEDRRMERAGWRLVNCRFNIRNAEIIVGWKSLRRMDRFRLNRPEQVETAIKESIAATQAGDVSRAVKGSSELEVLALTCSSVLLLARIRFGSGRDASVVAAG